MTDRIVYNQFERVYDNTGPQTAWAYFENPNDQFLEMGSEGYFIDFITTYINAPTIRTPVPSNTGSEENIREPFIKLWQNSGKIEKYSSIPNESFQPVGLLDDFLYSIKEYPKKWAKWITFQWTPEITPAFKTRRLNWEIEIIKAHELLCEIQDYNEFSSKLKGFLKEELSNLENTRYIDPAYEREYMYKAKISREDYGIAYALDWFLRGDSYSKKFCNSMIKFHNLRNNITYRKQDNYDMPYEIDWGKLLSYFVNKEVFKRDESFCDILFNLRTSTQKLKVHDQLIEYNKLCHPDLEFDPQIKIKKNRLLKEAIISSLDESKITPLFKNQKEFIDTINRVSEQADKLGFMNLTTKVATFVLNLSIASKYARSLTMSVAKQISPNFCFKIFDIPKIQKKV